LPITKVTALQRSSFPEKKNSFDLFMHELPNVPRRIGVNAVKSLTYRLKLKRRMLFLLPDHCPLQIALHTLPDSSSVQNISGLAYYGKSGLLGNTDGRLKVLSLLHNYLA
jgi:hypothetical protein